MQLTFAVQAIPVARNLKLYKILQSNTVPNTVIQCRLQELPANDTVAQINDKIIKRNPYTIPGMLVEAT